MKKTTQLLPSQNFDFIAFNLALSELQGRKIDIRKITVQMGENNKNWFLSRYSHFLRELKKRKHLSI